MSGLLHTISDLFKIKFIIVETHVLKYKLFISIQESEKRDLEQTKSQIWCTNVQMVPQTMWRFSVICLGLNSQWLIWFSSCSKFSSSKNIFFSTCSVFIQLFCLRESFITHFASSSKISAPQSSFLSLWSCRVFPRCWSHDHTC